MPEAYLELKFLIIVTRFLSPIFLYIPFICFPLLTEDDSRLSQNVPSPSSNRDYVKQTGHIASIDDFCIISKTDNSYDLLIHESLLLQKDRPILNSQQSSIFYGAVLILLFHSLLVFPLLVCLLSHNTFSYCFFLYFYLYCY